MNWPAWPLLPENLSRTTNIWRFLPQPLAHLFHLLPDELLIMESTTQGGDALAAGEQRHRKRVGIGRAAEQRELPAQPGPEQCEQLVRLGLRGVTQLRELAAQRADRAAVALNVGPVRDQDMDEASDAIG